MNIITREHINDVVDEVFMSVTEDIATMFADNVILYSNAVPNDEAFKWASPYLAAIKTVQDNYLKILKQSLEKLLCEEDAEVK